MSAPNVNNVLVGKPKVTGGIFVAPKGTALPTSATDPLDPAFECLGYVGEDGLAESIDNSTENVKAWGGDTVRVLQTEHSVMYKFTLLEVGRSSVLKTVYGSSNVDTTPATSSDGTTHTVRLNSQQTPAAVWVFEMADMGASVRVLSPMGTIKSLGETKYVDGEPTGFEVELEALPDGSGNKAYKYIVLDDATG